ncbi:MAG: hypothetical protein CSA07_04860 [Bacteroidia bacterium]|nr:MAG: hypothetical protein CSA07_04860 [Bacteroidia bacterium]
MKAVFIVYNQALSEQVQELLRRVNVRGYTRWDGVKGTGTHEGEPHLGTHTWPAINSSMLCVTTDAKAAELMQQCRQLNELAPEQGLKAFRWEVEDIV